MSIEQLIAYPFILIALYSLYRPTIFIYVVIALPVLSFAPTLNSEDNLFNIFKIGSVNIFLNDFIIVIFFIILIKTFYFNYYYNKERVLILLSLPISKCVFLIIAWNLFIGVMSYLKGFEAQSVLRKLSGDSFMLLCFLLPLFNYDNKSMRRIFRYCACLGVVIVAFGLIRYFALNEIAITSSGTTRALGAHAAGFLILPICISLFYWQHISQSRGLQGILFLLFSFGIALTGHRSAWMVLFVALSAFCFIQLKKNVKLAWVPLLFTFFILSICFVGSNVNIKPGNSFLGDILVRVNDTFDLDNKTTQGRLDKWDISVAVIKENTLLGLGRLPVHTRSIDVDNNSKMLAFDELNRSTHNVFFQKIIHEGALGFIILAIFLFVIFREMHLHDWVNCDLKNTIYLYLISFLLISQFSTYYFSSSGKIFLFIVLGIFNAEKLNKKMKLNIQRKCYSNNNILPNKVI